MLNRFAAICLIALAVVLSGLAGWGLIYLPDRMKAEAGRTIADLREVLARDAPGLTLSHGAISANPFTARVGVAEVSLGRPGGQALRAGELAFAIDPFSRKLSAVEALTLRFEEERAQLRIDRLRIEGVTEDALGLLRQAAEGAASTEAVVRRLDIPSLTVSGINITAPRDGEVNLRRIAIENVRKGIIGRLTAEGLNVYARSGPNSGEFALDRAGLAGLNFGEVALAVSQRNFWPRLTAPVIESISLEGMKVRGDEADFSVARGALTAAYGTNEAGRLYARKAEFAIDGIQVRPAGRAAKLREMLKAAGLERIDAAFKFASSGDHAARTMAIDEMSLRVKGLADVDLRLAVGNLPKGVFELGTRPEDVFPMMAEIMNATLTGGSLTVAEARFVKLAMDEAARKQGIDPMAMAMAMIGQAREEARRRGQTVFLALARELETFLRDPRSLKIVLKPPTPVPLGTFMGTAGIDDPARLVETLGLKVEANR
jgi:hypothetical protein